MVWLRAVVKLEVAVQKTVRMRDYLVETDIILAPLPVRL